jgi:DNA replication protein DnaC
MITLKQECAAEDAAAVTAAILKLFNAANMPHLADEKLYLGIPYPILQGFFEALSSQRSEDENKRFRNRMRYACIFKERTENTFKWDGNTYPYAEPGIIEHALTIGFIRQKKNLIMAGPPGVGKTLLAVIIACKALREGFSVRYKTAHDIVTDLQESRPGNSLSGYIKKMQSYDVLAIEDITFSTPDSTTAQDFFSIIDKRCGRKTTIITTNGNIQKWASDFPDKSMCTAILGRFYEEALLINMNGAEDMRLKRAKDILENIEANGTACP